MFACKSSTFDRQIFILEDNGGVFFFLLILMFFSRRYTECQIQKKRISVVFLTAYKLFFNRLSVSDAIEPLKIREVLHRSSHK